MVQRLVWNLLRKVYELGLVHACPDSPRSSEGRYVGGCLHKEDSEEAPSGDSAWIRGYALVAALADKVTAVLTEQSAGGQVGFQALRRLHWSSPKGQTPKVRHSACSL